MHGVFSLVLLAAACCCTARAPQERRWMDQHDAREGEAPYQARILYNNALACGAAVVHPSFVLTAKHCVKNWGSMTVEAGGLLDGALPVRREVVKVFSLNPEDQKHWLPKEVFEYDGGKKNKKGSKGPKGDIALLEVYPPFPTSIQNDLRPVPLRLQPVNEKVPCLLSGWSPKEGGAGSSMRLHVAEVNVFPRDSEECQEEKPMADHVCSGRVGGGVNSCQGDSGGPLVCYNESNHVWQLTAIVGKGRGCGESANLSKDTNVALYTKWIAHVIGMDSARIGFFWAS